MEPASIYHVVEESVELQRTRFTEHTIEVRLVIDPRMERVRCRETQIGQILTNLLNNTFDAIVQAECAERWISLTAEISEGLLALDFVDSGPGIADSVREHLMEPFFSTKKPGAGMGVGLSLSRAIAHDHGGELVLCDGTGHTHFRLTLPVGREIASPASEDRGREAPLPLTGVNVLIVDDETSLCDIFGKLLLAAGCGSVKTAENGEVALAILKARSIDLLITDLHMPVMDGLTLLRWLHEIGRSVSSVLFISSCADIDPEEMHALGVEALISKPCRPQQLIEAVVKAFAGRNCRESVDSTLRAFSEAETSV